MSDGLKDWWSEQLSEKNLWVGWQKLRPSEGVPHKRGRRGEEGEWKEGLYGVQIRKDGTGGKHVRVFLFSIGSRWLRPGNQRKKGRKERRKTTAQKAIGNAEVGWKLYASLFLPSSSWSTCSIRPLYFSFPTFSFEAFFSLGSSLVSWSAWDPGRKSVFFSLVCLFLFFFSIVSSLLFSCIQRDGMVIKHVP